MLLKTASCLHFCLCGLQSESPGARREARIGRNDLSSVWRSAVSKLETAFLLCSRRGLMRLVHHELDTAGLHKTEDLIRGYKRWLLPSFGISLEIFVLQLSWTHSRWYLRTAVCQSSERGDKWRPLGAPAFPATSAPCPTTGLTQHPLPAVAKPSVLVWSRSLTHEHA